jgi:hypothetical protein
MNPELDPFSRRKNSVPSDYEQQSEDELLDNIDPQADGQTLPYTGYTGQEGFSSLPSVEYGYDAPTELDQQEARRSLAEVESRALNDAVHAEDATTSVYEAAEKARHDREVEAAREKVSAAFEGQIATDIIESATVEAVEGSDLQTVHAGDIAGAYGRDESVMGDMQADAPDAEVADAYAELRERHDNADTAVDRVTRNTRLELQDYGMQNVASNEIAKEAVEAGREKVGQTSRREEITDTVVGEQLVTAITDKRKMTAELRDKLTALRSHPGELRHLAVAAAQQRNGYLSKATLRDAGQAVPPVAAQ